jgi:uncharacterized membrane protein
VEESAIQGEMKGYHPQNSSGNCRGITQRFCWRNPRVRRMILTTRSKLLFKNEATIMSTTPTPQAGGLTPNVAGGLAYITIIPAIIFLCIDPYRRDPFVRFHCFQSLFLAVAWFIVNVGIHFVPFVGWIIWPLAGLFFFIIWVIALINAFQGRKWLIPLIGPLAEQQAASGSFV